MRKRARNLLAVTTALVGHAAALVAITAQPDRPQPEAAPLTISLVGGDGLAAPVTIRAPAQPAPPAPPPIQPDPTPEPAPLEEPVNAEALTDIVARMIATTRPDFDIALGAVAETPPPNVPDFAALYEEALAAPPAASGGGEGCEITGALQAALQADAQVQAALNRIPIPARSVANAVLLWNGTWADPALLGGLATAERIRGAVQAGVMAEPEDCRDRPVTGPRFISLATGSGTAVLVLGSGSWRWSDLLEAAKPGP